MVNGRVLNGSECSRLPLKGTQLSLIAPLHSVASGDTCHCCDCAEIYMQHFLLKETERAAGLKNFKRQLKGQFSRCGNRGEVGITGH